MQSSSSDKMNIETLPGRIAGLLSITPGVLSTSALVQILGAELSEVHRAVESLTATKMIEERIEHHSNGWCLKKKTSIDIPKQISTGWKKKLIEYALTFPGVTFSELLVALKFYSGKPRGKAMLLSGALKASREKGEFRMISYIVQDIVNLPEGTLSFSELRDVLTIAEPMKIKELNYVLTREFITQNMGKPDYPYEKITALLRLAEVEYNTGDIVKSRKYLLQALDLSKEKLIFDWIPEILEVLAESTRNYQEMNETAEVIHDIIAWLPIIDDDDNEIEILAGAALSFAIIKRHKPARKTIESAFKLISTVSPSAMQKFEWSRARVNLVLGNTVKALQYLERALLLAENLNDQMAVSEILDAMVECMEKQPGYTVRSLSRSLEQVEQRAASSGNVSNQVYAMIQLTDMYSRTLQISPALDKISRCKALVEKEGLINTDPTVDWYDTFLKYQLNRPIENKKADLLIPGTLDFLTKIRSGVKPIEATETIVKFFGRGTTHKIIPQGLLLAMEATARGFTTESVSIASTLQRIYQPQETENIPSWNLCISGILSIDLADSDDFFSSAQVLARQMDRILFVWLILQVRVRFENLSGLDKSIVLLLLCELDEYIKTSLPSEFEDGFCALPQVSSRMRELRELVGENKTLEESRTVLEKRFCLKQNNIDRLESVSKRQFSTHSDISWSLEVLGVLTGADKVQVLNINDGEIRIIEGFGLGKNRLPGHETGVYLLNNEGRTEIIDNYMSSPFGSRKIHILPLSDSISGISGVPDRRTDTIFDEKNFILLEKDSPFQLTESINRILIAGFVKQINSELRFRNRERLSSYDSMTGAVIRSTWLKKLNMILHGDITPINPVSLLLFDVDFFKSVNDTFGHREGDNILRKVVTEASFALRHHDIIGRIGGDEFGVILPRATEENIEMIANRICRRIEENVFRPDRIPVTVSVGYTTANYSGDHSLLLIKRADAALYESKRTGRNKATEWNQSLTQIEHLKKNIQILDTGDPGWDHTLGSTVLELLAMQTVSVEILSEKLRNLLRCEFICVEDAEGIRSIVGPQYPKKILDSLPQRMVGKIHEVKNVLARYLVFFIEFESGIKIVTAWESGSNLPIGIRKVFLSLVNLAEMLLLRHGSAKTPPD